MCKQSNFEDEIKGRGILANRICCLFDCCDEDLADIFGVTKATLKNWKKRFPVFRETIEQGRQYYEEHCQEKFEFNRYDDGFANVALRACGLYNSSDEELAHLFGVEINTLLGWKRRRPLFQKKIKQGRDCYQGHSQKLNEMVIKQDTSR